MISCGCEECFALNIYNCVTALPNARAQRPRLAQNESTMQNSTAYADADKTFHKEGISHQIALSFASPKKCRTELPGMRPQTSAFQDSQPHCRTQLFFSLHPTSCSCRLYRLLCSLMQEGAQRSITSPHHSAPSGYSGDCELGCPCATVADRAQVSSSQSHR
jgi:hypothetical protein